MSEHLHLEALHDSLRIPFDTALTVRANKRNIIDGLGFTSGTNPTEFVNILPSELANADVYTVLANTVSRDMYSALLFEDGEWQHLGGAPVVYIMDTSDIVDKICFDERGIIYKVQTTNGQYEPSHIAGLKIFSRKKSVPQTLSGFENYENTEHVRLGGGFRLQVDELNYEGVVPVLTCSAHFSFNDYGSRVLAKENPDDSRVPMAGKSFKAKIIDGELEFPTKDIDRTDFSTANDVIDAVLTELFSQDGKAINNLLRQLLTIRSAMHVHQLEGIYGITEQNGISAEVIDFDGLDTFDLVPLAPTPVERLAGGQLLRSGYLRELDAGARVAYFGQKNSFEIAHRNLDSSLVISEAVRLLAMPHLEEDITLYAKRLYAYGRLARSIRYCGIEWSPVDVPYVMQARIKDVTITKVEAGGFESAYVEQNEMLQPVTNANEIYTLMKKMFGSEALRLYVTLSKEGD